MIVGGEATRLMLGSAAELLMLLLLVGRLRLHSRVVGTSRTVGRINPMVRPLRTILWGIRDIHACQYI